MASSPASKSRRDSQAKWTAPDREEHIQSEPHSKTESKLHVKKALQNMTKSQGDTLKLRCDFAGAPDGGKLRITWLRNDASLEDFDDERITIKNSGPHSSRLRISELAYLDRGFYSCRAQTEDGLSAESTMILKVKASALDYDNRNQGYPGLFANMPTNMGGGIPSMGSGIPNMGGGLPNMGGGLPNMGGGLPHIGGLGNRPMGASFGKNPGNFPPGFVKEFGNMEGSEFHPDDPNTYLRGGKCEIYRGAACENYLSNQTVYVRPGLSIPHLEEKLAGVLTVVRSSHDVSPECLKFAFPSLCMFAFPPCDKTVHAHKPQMVCRDECELLEEKICRMEYSIAKRHPVIGPANILPDCKKLPERESREGAKCLALGIPLPKIIQLDEDQHCYEGIGETYRGAVSVGISGNPCQPWHHQILYSRVAAHEGILGGHSYCRNPDGSESGPWCFTEGNRKEICNIPKCADYMWLYVIVPSVAAVALVSLLVSVFCIRRRASSKPPPTSLVNNSLQALKVAKNGSATQSRINTMELNKLLPRTQVRAPEFPLSSIKFIEELGEGAFGKVYRGSIMGYDWLATQQQTMFNNRFLNGTPNGELPVAIKTLKENATAKVQHDFQREAELMADLHHPNIVCLVGVVTRQEPMCLLFEYMEHGDLHEYLIAHSPARADSINQTLEFSDFLHICRQIAAGMEFLAAHHYVHRDLAARNALVGENMTVKISDFGLSRDIYSSDYYRVQSKSLLPVRWMPPEAILYGKFTAESDVWSFGVVMWEVFSYGCQPYYGYNNQEVIDMIRARQLLPCPEECPSHVYSMMVECWHEVSARRPSFTELHARLCSWQAMHARSVSQGSRSQSSTTNSTMLSQQRRAMDTSMDRCSTPNSHVYQHLIHDPKA
ncbi:tyrosine-protein kinase transmembrane receptor Ror-like [Galendromus occidentalis]|uniref:receptor protein-tyrosine kinase n=1 Tax=Galendromus occidentalis TaxID=34638 RepID=A0AAJ7WJI2_9ACAR|nr:tyrosine-protein kinase transmembrane receptor Ror-like [Galendromus occidentalis]